MHLTSRKQNRWTFDMWRHCSVVEMVAIWPHRKRANSAFQRRGRANSIARDCRAAPARIRILVAEPGIFAVITGMRANATLRLNKPYYLYVVAKKIWELGSVLQRHAPGFCSDSCVDVGTASKKVSSICQKTGGGLFRFVFEGLEQVGPRWRRNLRPEA